MLTDIFAMRYQSAVIWPTFDERSKRLITQCFRIVSEQICPFYRGGQEYSEGKHFWEEVHKRLSMELGVKSLSPLAYSYNTKWQGKDTIQTGVWSIFAVCENWMLKPFSADDIADTYMKERVSLVELSFRIKEEQLARDNADLPKKLIEARLKLKSPYAMVVPGDPVEAVRYLNETKNNLFKDAVSELNTRFMQASANIHYHNGLIQVARDDTILEQVERPFWQLLADPKWKNVDVDFKEAVDRRDNADRDPAFYAMRSLESALKIVCESKSLNTGKEKGAHNFIDNLASKRADYWLKAWEAEQLKALFTHVRNPLGHGPGSQQMPKQNQNEINLALNLVMAWITALVSRS